MATNGMDLGAVSMMIYGWREREEVLRFFQKVTGLRMNHNYIRPGGVAADLPAGWRDDVAATARPDPRRLEEYDILMTGQPIWRERLQGVGVITPTRRWRSAHRADPAFDRRRLGPAPRHAVPRIRRDRLRRHRRHVRRRFDRYAIRLDEIRESMQIVRQILDAMPEGDYRIQDKKVTPPPRARIDESMEALIHHFKIFTEGFKVPEGEVYVAIESPARRARVLHRVRRRAEAVPHAHAGPVVRQPPVPAAHDARRLVADAVAIISSRRSRSWERWTDEGTFAHRSERGRSRARSSRATRARSRR